MKNRFIYWTPRILAILFILFLAVFSLDVFDAGYGFWELILGLFMHNIPAIILLIVLIIAWRHELVGAIGFILGGFGLIGIIGWNRASDWLLVALLSLIVALPAFIIGILFFVGWKRKT